jgi:catalase
VEQAHIVEAFTFELGKCLEQSVKERELQVLANVDRDLCEQVVAEPGPVAGRKIGVIADAAADLASIGKLRKAAAKLGASVLVIAPVGGILSHGTGQETVERTLLTARSVEFDALVVADGTTPSGDIKLVLLLQEASPTSW